VNSVAEARGYLEHLLVSIGLKNRLSSMGIEKDEDVDLIVANGFDPNRVKNNPRSLDEAALRRLLEEIR
jgi:alcohol dehydrogenase class IV